MSFTNFQKTIALTGGVLVLSVAVALIAIAWTGPGQPPPDDNAPAPINVGSDAQTKAGDLTVYTFKTSGGKIYLNNSGFEGDIERVDEIIGHNDLQLRSDPTSKTEILLDDGTQGIKLKHQGTDVLVVGDDAAVHFPELTTPADFTGCFLEIDENGKVRCYEGGSPPGGNVLETAQTEVAYAHHSVQSTICSNPYKVEPAMVEKVVRFRALGAKWCSSSWAPVSFWFYVKPDGEAEFSEWQEYRNGNFDLSEYYYLSTGDTVRVCVKTMYPSCTRIEGWIYTLASKRDNIKDAYIDNGDILYWFDQDAFHEMIRGGLHYEAAENPFPPPTYPSVIISAKDSEPVTLFTE